MNEWTWAADGSNTLRISPLALFIVFIVFLVVLTLVQIFFMGDVFAKIGSMKEEPPFLNIALVFGYVFLLIFHTGRFLFADKVYTPTVFWTYICRMVADLLVLINIHAWLYFVLRDPGPKLADIRSFVSTESYQKHYERIESRLHWNEAFKYRRDKTAQTKATFNWYYIIYAALWWMGWILWEGFLFYLNTAKADYHSKWTLIGTGITSVLVFTSLALNCETYYLSFAHSYFYQLISKNINEYKDYKYNKNLPSAAVSLDKMINSVTSNARCFLITTLLYTLAVGFILAPSAFGNWERLSASQGTVVIETTKPSAYEKRESVQKLSDVAYDEVIILPVYDSTENNRNATEIEIIGVDKRGLKDVALFYIVTFLLLVGFFSFFVIYHVPRTFFKQIHHDWVMIELQKIEDLDSPNDLSDLTKKLKEDKLNMSKTYEVYLVTIITIAIQIIELILAFIKLKN